MKLDDEKGFYTVFNRYKSIIVTFEFFYIPNYEVVNI